ncbi:MAG: hypothetical protein QOF51_3421 [Chloroflexota bacterium]|jgi:ribosomal protein S18 acetylase RimI-like enzyme|nr:hypothetical protein [Chloroflexota bacterium]
MTSVRHALPDDAATIADIQVRAWQWAYAGHLPADHLAGLTAELPEREARWRERLTNPDPEERIWVTSEDERILGFLACGLPRGDERVEGEAQIHTLYLEPDAVGTGVGRLLFSYALDDLRRRGFRAVVLWVFDSNARARRFYEIAGFQPDGTDWRGAIGDFEWRVLHYRRELP